MKTLALFLLTLYSVSAFADDISVVDVKRNITLSDEDTVYKDFYINAGESSPLRKNMVVKVKRKINVKDAGTKSVGDFETVVGELKIIHIAGKVSVAREFKLWPRENEPMLEQTGIMTGDRIDLTGSYIDNSSKPKVKNADAGVLNELEAKNNISVTEEASKAPEATAPAAPPTEQPASTEREPANLLNKIIPMPSI